MQTVRYFEQQGDRVVQAWRLRERGQVAQQVDGEMEARRATKVVHTLEDAGWDSGVTFERIATMDEYRQLTARLGTRRVEVERRLGAAHLEEEQWVVTGYCEACQAPADFVVGWEYSDHVVPNYREHLVCPTCGLNNRQRFVASSLARLVGESSANVYLYEQVTPTYRWAKSQLPHCSVTGSEYLGPEVAPGAVIDGIRHEDALNLTFASESLDIIVSTDVYEHVPDIEKTIAEARRVLRPGGKLLFSVPFFVEQQQTVQRAVLEANGQLRHLHPPQYHGNPVSPDEGSLVFFDHGWDLLDRFRQAGFSDAYALAYYNWFYGYLGEGLQLVFVAER
jgi:SAM-dependent methyltransferase